MARRPERISLASLIEAVEGPIRLTRCCDVEFEIEAQECQRVNRCLIKEPMQTLHTSFRRLLEQLTIRDLASNALPPVVGLALAQARTDPKPADTK